MRQLGQIVTLGRASQAPRRDSLSRHRLRRGTLAVSVVVGSVVHTPRAQLKTRLSAEENQHSMSLPSSTRWSHRTSAPARARTCHRQERAA